MALLRVGRAVCPRLALVNTESRAWVSSLEEVRRINGREEAVVMTDDSKTIVCWHPQPDIPYEMTKPLPEAPTVDSVLKVQAQDTKKLFKNKHPFFVNKALRELTFTTKHLPQKRFAKKNPPRDREYL
ncbi:39S ribosomal protein L42, mitochondrial [Portunus trituberculatus]|uniref:Large ribosomal subunit protein mL42 n=1 Tax=Portunus trituberculatus TaxID=210409 RepID=A0A5B7DZ38_PORTR|nr:39S ribosomal protein L42, mitochondrial [Portunus trituberculatus]